MDDVIVHDVDEASHVVTIRRFVERIRAHNLKLAPGKACLGGVEAELLGHSISTAGTAPNGDMVSALTSMPKPENVGQLRSLCCGFS